MMLSFKAAATDMKYFRGVMLQKFSSQEKFYLDVKSMESYEKLGYIFCQVR